MNEGLTTATPVHERFEMSKNINSFNGTYLTSCYTSKLNIDKIYNTHPINIYDVIGQVICIPED